MSQNGLTLFQPNFEDARTISQSQINTLIVNTIKNGGDYMGQKALSYINQIGVQNGLN